MKMSQYNLLVFSTAFGSRSPDSFIMCSGQEDVKQIRERKRKRRRRRNISFTFTATFTFTMFKIILTTTNSHNFRYGSIETLSDLTVNSPWPGEREKQREK